MRRGRAGSWATIRDFLAEHPQPGARRRRSAGRPRPAHPRRQHRRVRARRAGAPLRRQDPREGRPPRNSRPPPAPISPPRRRPMPPSSTCSRPATTPTWRAASTRPRACAFGLVAGVIAIERPGGVPAGWRGDCPRTAPTACSAPPAWRAWASPARPRPCSARLARAGGQRGHGAHGDLGPGPPGRAGLRLDREPRASPTTWARSWWPSWRAWSSARPSDGRCFDAAEALAAWLEHLTHERRASPRTVRAYGDGAAAYLAFLEQHRGGALTLSALSDVSAADVRAYLAFRRAGERPLSPRSVSQALSAIRAFHRFLDRRLETPNAAIAHRARAARAARAPRPVERGPGAGLIAEAGFDDERGAWQASQRRGADHPALGLRPAHFRGAVAEARRRAARRERADHRQGRQDPARAGAAGGARGDGRLPRRPAVRARRPARRCSAPRAAGRSARATPRR